MFSAACFPAFGLGWWASFWAIICATMVREPRGRVRRAHRAEDRDQLDGQQECFLVRRTRAVPRLHHSAVRQPRIQRDHHLGGFLALVPAIHCLAGTSDGTGALIIGMAIVAIVMSVLGLLGHATLIVSFKFVAITNVILMVVFILITHSHFPVPTRSAPPISWAVSGRPWLLGLTLAILVNCCSSSSHHRRFRSFVVVVEWLWFWWWRRRRVRSLMALASTTTRGAFPRMPRHGTFSPRSPREMFAGNALAYLMGACRTPCASPASRRLL